MTKLTPAMKQYMDIKDNHSDCIVFFRMGDFYETFYEDAKTVARELDIVLTARGKGEKRAPLAGIPYHALDNYLAKLVKRGHKVCLVEQLEDPKKAKGIVRRGVVRIVTPGTVIEDNILSHSSNNFICAVNKEDNKFGITICDVSTGEFSVTETDDELKLMSEIEKFRPAEIIVPMSMMQSDMVENIKRKDLLVNEYDDRFFWKEKSYKVLINHFGTATLEGYGIEDKELAITSSGALLSYIKDTQMNSMQHIRNIHYYNVDEYMILDSSTQRNLELLRNIKDGSSRGTLFEVLNKTVTSMGARKLKRWLLLPLIDKEDINRRLDSVEELLKNQITKEDIKDMLKDMSDIERISTRITYKTANPRDLVSLKNSLLLLPKLKELMKDYSSEFLSEIRDMNSLSDVAKIISDSIKDEPAVTVREGNIIRKGYSKELDELRALSKDGKKWITSLEESEKERTGIKSLKVKFNKVFGYFIEVTKSNIHLVPDEYIRKQTQANCERYVTEDLKKKEDMILGAQDKIHALEFEMFSKILDDVSERIDNIQECASKISSLDCLLGMATVSSENRYIRPEITDDNIISIKDARHPVVERIEDSFVPNDCIFDDETMKIITGPNMAGKSTFLRQNALIVLMSHIGCFVPASFAKIGIVDRIFTRVGAYDDLSMGQSTFMVEMIETANILNNATSRSFVILDEIGRGTSTYDGFSLAWAIAEYLYNDIGAKAIFATHYHHLNKLSEKYSGIKNYNVLVNEDSEDIVFLHKIIKGGTDRSYGIHVAKLAGLPKKVIEESKKIMSSIEDNDIIKDHVEPSDKDSSKVNEDNLSIEDDNIKREIHITETITKKNKNNRDKKQETLLDW